MRDAAESERRKRTKEKDQLSEHLSRDPRLDKEINLYWTLCERAINGGEAKSEARDGQRARRLGTEGPQSNSTTEPRTRPDHAMPVRSTRSAGSSVPPGVRLNARLHEPSWDRYRERLQAAVAEQIRRPKSEQNPLPLVALLLEIQQARFGGSVAAREDLLTQWRGYQASSVASAAGRTVSEVRRKRAEAGLEPAKGIDPIPEAGPEDRKAHILSLRFGEQRMDPSAIANRVGKDGSGCIR